jgi:hypothetical protein
MIRWLQTRRHIPEDVILYNKVDYRIDTIFYFALLIRHICNWVFSIDLTTEEEVLYFEILLPLLRFISYVPYQPDEVFGFHGAVNVYLL